MQKKKNPVRPNNIVALCIISESELAKVLPNYGKHYEEEMPTMFKQILHSLGMDTTLPIERQDGLWHRNRLNEVVLCSRYVGHERLDLEWITSGYASTSAKDKASGCKLIEDMYRAKNLTQDRQDQLAARDHYKEPDETEGIT